MMNVRDGEIINQTKALFRNKIYSNKDFVNLFKRNLQNYIQMDDDRETYFDGLQCSIYVRIPAGSVTYSDELINPVGNCLTNSIYQFAVANGINDCIGLVCPIFQLFSVTVVNADRDHKYLYIYL